MISQQINPFGCKEPNNFGEGNQVIPFQITHETHFLSTKLGC